MIARNLSVRFQLVVASVVALAVGAAIVLASGLAFVQTHIEQAIELEELVVELHQLRILGAEYVATPTERIHQQWMATYRRVKDRIGRQAAMPAEVQEVLDDMAPLFERFTALATAPDAPGSARRRLTKQVAATLDMEAQRVIDWASGVSHDAKAGIVPRLSAAGGAILGAMMLVALATVATTLFTSRRILSSVERLKSTAAEIATGRLGLQVATAGDDEMAGLAASINRMSAELAGTYERLRERTTQLETEAAERARVEQEHARLEDQYQQAQKMEAVGLLAGGVAHDFNNLLSVILACGSMLKRGASADEAPECVEEILGAARQAAELTRGLLAFGRKQAFRLERTDLNEVAAESAKFLKRMIGEDVELVLEPAPSPVCALVDRFQIQQVLMNLAANARDAMPRGGRLTIRIGTEQPGDDVLAVDGYGRAEPHALLRVSDNGTGMGSETVGRIFEPFYTTKEKGHGTGLGLSITHGIVVQHRGHIVCRSAPGAGSTFSVYLPICEDAEQAPLASAGDPTRSLRGRETVLVAEDDAMLMRSTTRICETSGYRVIQARDGAEAVSLFERHADEIDLVILDAVMPRMTGREAWERIRSLRPAVKGCFVSGYALDPRSGELAIDPGVAFVSKPFTPESLLRKMREILDA